MCKKIKKKKKKICDLYLSRKHWLLPPFVVMSQYTFNGLPVFLGSIQYFPSPNESPESRMSLQDWAGR